MRQQAPETYFLTFNPKSHGNVSATVEDIYLKCIRDFELGDGEKIQTTWHSPHRRPRKGDRFYILEQGRGDNGLENGVIGFGVFECDGELRETPDKASISIYHIHDPRRWKYLVLGNQIKSDLPGRESEVRNNFNVQGTGRSPIPVDIADSIDRAIFRSTPHLARQLALTYSAATLSTAEEVDRRISPEDSAERARRNKELGNYGEQIGVEFLGRLGVANGWKIEHVSRELGESEGYDVRASKIILNSQRKLFIEIKTSLAPLSRARFFLSENERKTLKAGERNSIILLVHSVVQAKFEEQLVFSGGKFAFVRFGQLGRYYDIREQQYCCIRRTF